MTPSDANFSLPIGASAVEDPEKAAAIKALARELLGLPDSAVLFVSESCCADPACPLVETVLAVFEEQRTRKWSFARPRYAVSRLLLQQILEANPEGMP